MGEYAKYNNERVKIGTCEDMLYLRADQRRQVRPEHGNVNPMDAEHCKAIRFRFPWPDEDNVEPGAFDDPFRRMAVHQTPPAELEHHSIQFVAQSHGYNVCLPCPEGPDSDAHGLTVHRNGFAGATFLSQQAFRGGNLVPVFECVCGARWAAWTLDLAAEAIEDLTTRADKADRLRRLDPDYERIGDDPHATRLRTIALRIGAGYRAEVAATG